jgi:hypothetical protein
MSPQVSGKQRYVQVYVVLRVERDATPDAAVMTFERDGKIIPAAGPSGVTVKEVVLTAEEAQDEVIRLNKLNGDKGCVYYWQSTHLFTEGGSHGGPAAT